MVELVDLVTTLLSVAVGAFLGAFLTYFTSMRLEKRERNRRKKNVVQLLFDDIYDQLLAAILVNSEIDNYTISGNERKNIRSFRFNVLLSYADFYKRDVFLSVLPDLTLLESDCHGAVTLYYDFAEIMNREIMIHLKAKDVSLLKVVAIRINGILYYGTKAVSYLYADIDEIKVEEANKLVQKLLSTYKEDLKKTR